MRKPTEEELLALRVNCIFRPTEVIVPKSIQQSKKEMTPFHLHTPGKDNSVLEEELQVSDFNVDIDNSKGKRTADEWKELLAYPLNKVVENTTEVTMKLQNGPVESDRRETPKQHRKKRLIIIFSKMTTRLYVY